MDFFFWYLRQQYHYHTFACGDRNVCDQGVQFVGGVFVLITLPGQTYAHPVWHVPAQQQIQSWSVDMIKFHTCNCNPQISRIEHISSV